MAKRKPTFILVHGAWHTPSCFNPIISPLQSHGYKVLCPSLPSAGANPVVLNFTPDVDVIRSTCLTELDDCGNDVVLVLHSYAGLPGGEALRDLDVKSRTKEGKTSAVIRLVYLTGFLVPEGFRHSSPGTRENMVEGMITDFEKQIVTVSPSAIQPMLYQDLSPSLLAKISPTLVAHSLSVYWSQTTYASWRYIPTTYVRGLLDMPSTIAATKYLIDDARKNGLGYGKCCVDRVVEKKVGHAPFVSQVGWTVELLRREAGENGLVVECDEGDYGGLQILDIND